MKKGIIGLFVLATFSINGIAQKYKDFKFSEKPDFGMTEEMKKEEELVVKKVYSNQYIVSSEEEAQYVFIHTARWLNSDDVIEKNNKIYLAASESSEYLFQKARVIKPSGEITVLKDSDIKEGVYEENEQKYYYFAIDGLEKGSIIETANYKKVRPNYYGGLIYLQEDVKRYQQEFELICPYYLEFAFKSLNEGPEVVYDTNITEYNRWSIELDSVGEVLDQPTMYEDVVKQAVLYKIDRNNAKNRGDLTSYGSAAENIFNNVHPELSKSQKKKLAKLFKELGIEGMKNEEEKIRAIENYLKSTFQVVDSPFPDLAKIDFIIENKAANETGMTIFHLALLKMAEIKYELVITTDRSEIRFDPDFEAYLFLDKYLIYFPKSKSYLAPSEKFLRSPFVPSEWTHNNGLFIKQVGIGDVVLPIGKVKFIKALPYTETKDVMKIAVDFEDDLSNPTVDIEKISTGYSAQYFQPFFHLMDEEALGNLEKEIVKTVHEEIEADEVEFENIEENDFGSKPFIFRFKSDEHSFVEKAGEDYLFKLGLLIGPQMEMYQEKERQYDVESANTRYYGRTINFNIPEGYTIKNLDDLNMDHKFGNAGSENLYFQSDYKLDGNKVTVDCVEYYTDIIYPKGEFDKYKEVINAAADFNKIVLVLQKIK